MQVLSSPEWTRSGRGGLTTFILQRSLLPPSVTRPGAAPRPRPRATDTCTPALRREESTTARPAGTSPEKEHAGIRWRAGGDHVRERRLGERRGAGGDVVLARRRGSRTKRAHIMTAEVPSSCTDSAHALSVGGTRKSLGSGSPRTALEGFHPATARRRGPTYKWPESLGFDRVGPRWAHRKCAPAHPARLGRGVTCRQARSSVFAGLTPAVRDRADKQPSETVRRRAGSPSPRASMRGCSRTTAVAASHSAIFLSSSLLACDECLERIERLPQAATRDHQ